MKDEFPDEFPHFPQESASTLDSKIRDALELPLKQAADLAEQQVALISLKALLGAGISLSGLLEAVAYLLFERNYLTATGLIEKAVDAVRLDEPIQDTDHRDR